ncbi:MAG: SDR family oxidoreductase [Actinomycetota bacterium]|nr:SDR family oxidoreductase [Actinomycetota bacterium]
MRIILTGSEGYLGRVVGPWLSGLGHEVASVDIGLFSDHPAELSECVDVRDLNVVDLVGYDCVVHLAGLSNDACADLQPSAAFAVNEHAAVRLAGVAKRAGLRGFIFASTCSVYGHAQDPCTEDDITAPLSRYARTKLAAERGILAECSAGFSAVALRLGTVYGPSPGIRSDLVLNRMVACGLFDGRVVVHGDGSQRRPMVHVREVAAAIEGILALLPALGGQIFNVAGERGNLRIRDIAERVGEVLGATVTTENVMADPRDYVVDSTKLRSLGIRLDEDLEPAIIEMEHIFRERFGSLERTLGVPQNRAGAVAALMAAGTVDGGLRWRRDTESVRKRMAQ